MKTERIPGSKSGLFPWGLSSSQRPIESKDFILFEGKRVPTYILRTTYQMRLKLPKYISVIADHRKYRSSAIFAADTCAAVLNEKLFNGFPIKVRELNIYTGEISVQYTTCLPYNKDTFKTFRRRVWEILDDFLEAFRIILEELINEHPVVKVYKGYRISKETGRICFSRWP